LARRLALREPFFDDLPPHAGDEDRGFIFAPYQRLDEPVPFFMTLCGFRIGFIHTYAIRHPLVVELDGQLSSLMPLLQYGDRDRIGPGVVVGVDEPAASAESVDVKQPVQGAGRRVPKQHPFCKH